MDKESRGLPKSRLIWLFMFLYESVGNTDLELHSFVQWLLCLDYYFNFDGKSVKNGHFLSKPRMNEPNVLDKQRPDVMSLKDLI